MHYHIFIIKKIKQRLKKKDYKLALCQTYLKDHSDSELPMVATKGFVGTESHSSVSFHPDRSFSFSPTGVDFGVPP